MDGTGATCFARWTVAPPAFNSHDVQIMGRVDFCQHKCVRLDAG
jgi:hypothetical protein